MYDLVLEVTNLCNRDCIHCLRNQADAGGAISLETVATLLAQARSLAMKSVCLTGGEVAVYPDLPGLLGLIADYGFQFNLITNGFRFKNHVLPILLNPTVRKKLTSVWFSLDGARAETHDALRGKGSFKEVLEAATLCKMQGISTGFKSMITNFNKGELLEMALLGATLGAEDQNFIYPFPVPRAIRAGILPSPEELHKLVLWIRGSLEKAFKTRIGINGYTRSQEGLLFNCGLTDSIYVEYQGNIILCCNLSHFTAEDGVPTRFGGEYLGNLQEISLQEGIIRHFHAAARLVEARLQDRDNLNELTQNICYWCFKHFGKFDWLKNYPQSPWAAGVLPQNEGKLELWRKSSTGSNQCCSRQNKNSSG
jgi:MoaA/NifB/PqqE/SkfB family radical SAM enzyme